MSKSATWLLASGARCERWMTPHRPTLCAVCTTSWLALTLGTVASSPAQSRPDLPDPAPVAAAVSSQNSTSLTFIGPSGQVYIHEGQWNGSLAPADDRTPDRRPAAPRRDESDRMADRPDDRRSGRSVGRLWQRQIPGGVAAEVIGAVRTPEGTIFVAGRRTPLFRLDSGVWHANPLPNRGRTIFSAPGGAPVLAVGRHIYVWQSAMWRRLASTRTRVTAVWAEIDRSGYRVVAATEAGKLMRIRGGSRQTIRHPLPVGDQVVALVGRAGKKTYAVARSGAVLELTSAAARLLALPSPAGFRVHAATVDSDGGLWLTGQPLADPSRLETAGSASAAELVLVYGNHKVLTPMARLTDIDSQDRITVIHVMADGVLVLATKNGEVRLRSRDGTWQNGKVSSWLPRPAPSGDMVGPARTN
ncbi:MAG: hypothetical protein MJE77_44245 [Proteobacteria bacterium]|nr:hypothetical protein [Pseudomonadota bacterium]